MFLKQSSRFAYNSNYSCAWLIQLSRPHLERKHEQSRLPRPKCSSSPGERERDKAFLLCNIGSFLISRMHFPPLHLSRNNQKETTCPHWYTLNNRSNLTLRCPWQSKPWPPPPANPFYSACVKINHRTGWIAPSQWVFRIS